MERLHVLSAQVRSIPRCSENDVVICAALRTPITKSKQGEFKDTFPEELLSQLFQELFRKTEINPTLIEDICIGNALQHGAGALSSRIGAILGNVPTVVPVQAVNRQCSSGLQAVANIAASIAAGIINVGVAGGVESMTHFDMMEIFSPEKLSESVFQTETARNCLLPMGQTSEILADRFGITREMQDAFAVNSHAKAHTAQQSGLFSEEIVPIDTVVKDEKGNERKIRVTRDGGIRPGTNLETLAKLRPAFKTDGTTTAGNSSQVSDGAALVLLARRSTAATLQLPILGRFVSYACVGVSPEIMGIGPTVAIPKALAKAGISQEDVAIFEINEAFASQCCYCVEKLGIAKEKVNPKGGAIALGHPLGCTGARQIATLLPELKRRGKRYGVVSMCVGTGMGAAAVIENLIV